MDQKQRLLFVTGTRADFGKIEPLAKAAIQNGFDVTFFVTGMHMMESYGLTKIEVKRLPNAIVHEFVNQRPGDPQDVILAKTMLGFSDFIVEEKPDLVLIHGDRVEALACALVCATNYVKCAHIEGGEVSGTIDEILRHCNSKLAYCHFVSSKTAGKRVQTLGESIGSIHVIGSPELDIHGQPSGFLLQDVLDHYEIRQVDYGICIMHPVTSEADNMGQQATNLFNALQQSDKFFIVIKPNNDPGSERILSVIDSLPEAQFKVIPSIQFERFSELLRNAACIVGNSSAGVREAPFLGIPSLDVGSRQTDRAFSASITKILAHDTDGIFDFIKTDWQKRYHRQTEFGDGTATQKFVELLKSREFWQHSMQKQFHDISS